VAVRHGLHRNQIFTWRRQLRNQAALVGAGAPVFVPATLAAPAETGPAMMGNSSRIEVITAGLTIRLGTGFDTGDLRRVLQSVRELT
jgi:transposase